MQKDADLKKDIWQRSILRVVPLILIAYLFWIFACCGFSRFGKPPGAYILMRNMLVILGIPGIGMLFLKRWAWFLWIIALPVFSAALIVDAYNTSGDVALAVGGIVLPMVFWIAILLPRLRRHYR